MGRERENTGRGSELPAGITTGGGGAGGGAGGGRG